MSRYIFIILALMLFAGGCVTQSDIAVLRKELNGDFRLRVATPLEIESLTKMRVCKVLADSEMEGASHTLFVGEGTPLKNLFPSYDAGFLHDSRVVVVKKGSITRRPGWYETDKLDERESFGNMVIVPGDFIWLPAVQ